MPEQRDIEIALRDSLTTGMRQIGREIDAVTRKMREADASGDTSFNKLGKSLNEFKETADKSKTSMMGLSGFMIGMSRTMLGATGLAAGFYAIGKSLENFAEKRVQLQNLSTDLGFTTDKISIMQRTLSRMGVETNEQQKLISNFGHTLKDAFRLGAFSPFIQQLTAMGESNFAAKLLDMFKKGGTFDQATDEAAKRFEEIEKKFGPGSPQAVHFANVLQIPESVLRGWREATAEQKAAYQTQYEAAQEHLKNMLELEHFAQDTSKRAEEWVMKAYNAAFRALKAIDWKSILENITPPKPEGYKDERGGLQEPKKMGTFWDSGEGDLPSKSRLSAFVDRGMQDEDRKTNRLLGEINDTLKMFESKARGDGGGSGITLQTPGGGYSSGPVSGPAATGAQRAGAWQGAPGLSQHATPARAHSATGSPLSNAQNAPTQTHVPMPEGNPARSARGSWYSQLPGKGWVDKGDRPGSNALGVPDSQQGIALPSRKTLGKYFRVTGPDGKTAILQQTDIGPAKFTKRGIDISAAGADQMGYTPRNFPTNGNFTYAPVAGPEGKSVGDPGRPVRGGVDETVKFLHQGADGERFAFRTNQASNIKDGLQRIQTGSGVGTSVSGEAAPHFQGFLDDLEAAGAPISSVGGFNRRRIAGSSRMSQHSYGNAIDINQSARNIVTPAFAKWARENPDKLREFEHKHGLVSGASWRSPDFGHWEFGGKQAPAQLARDRDTVDKTMRRKTHSQQKTSMKGEVDFSNVPAPTKKNGDEEGKFKLLKLNTNPQMSKDHEGMLAPGDMAHTPFVP